MEKPVLNDSILISDIVDFKSWINIGKTIRGIKHRGPLRPNHPPILYERPHKFDWTISAYLVDQ